MTLISSHMFKENDMPETVEVVYAVDKEGHRFKVTREDAKARGLKILNEPASEPTAVESKKRAAPKAK